MFQKFFILQCTPDGKISYLKLYHHFIQYDSDGTIFRKATLEEYNNKPTGSNRIKIISTEDSPNEAYLFNHDMIQKVSFVGYDKEEGKEYRNKLKDESEENTGIKIMDDNQNTIPNNEESSPNNKTNVFDQLRV